jgi:hypothetical protein
MPRTVDFRLSPFNLSLVVRCAQYTGRQPYSKLYAIENLVRVIIHSVLSLQTSEDWWSKLVDRAIQQKAERFQKNYFRKPWHGSPGSHGIYYIDLKDLNEIMRANANLFHPVIPHLDRWIAGIEELRLPRNMVAHMNFPSATDVKRIDVFHADCLSLLTTVQSKIPLKIP